MVSPRYVKRSRPSVIPAKAGIHASVSECNEGLGHIV